VHSMIPGSENFVSRRSRRRIDAPASSHLRLHTVTVDEIAALDPMTYEVVRHRLWSITDEMATRFGACPARPSSPRRTTSILRSTMNAAGSANRLVNTMLAGAVDLAIYWTLQNRAENPGIEDGDMFLCNDPWIGGGLHHPTPRCSRRYSSRAVVCWTSAVAHQPISVDRRRVRCRSRDGRFSESLPTRPSRSCAVRSCSAMWRRLDAALARAAADRPRPARQGGANAVGRRRLLSLIAQYGPCRQVGDEAHDGRCGTTLTRQAAYDA